MDKVKNTFVVYGGTTSHFLHSESVPKPNPKCLVCTCNYLLLHINLDLSLGELISALQEIVNGELAIQKGNELIYDVEYEDLVDKKLAELVKDGDELLVTSDDDVCYSIVLFVKSVEEYG
jgi:hypothetical protein